MVVNHFESTVYSLEPATSERAKLAEALGSRYVSGQDVPIKELQQRTGAFDVIYEAVGFSKVAFAALSALGPNGVFIFTGVPALGGPKEIDADRLMRDIVLQNQVLFGTVNASPSAYELALRELEQAMFLFPESLPALISSNHPMQEAPSLIMKSGGIKQVVHLGTATQR
jgi:threonine dehydrogenase-like Zn-dependent dehydrogenase